jgi:hypothetical protein
MGQNYSILVHRQQQQELGPTNDRGEHRNARTLHDKNDEKCLPSFTEL